MKIALFSDDDLDVSVGLDLLITKYAEQSPEVIFPAKVNQDDYTQSIIRTCLENSVKVTMYFKNAEGLDHLLKQTDDFVLCDDPVQEVLRQLTLGDAVGIVWTDSLTDHLVVHNVEDLALDIWDITDGIDSIEMDDDPFIGMNPDDLHAGMHKAMDVFIDMMAAYIASTVMDSLGQAVMEHLLDQEDKKDISPFDEQE
jgi:hypothetical protein